jgi:hypothetical protein
VFFRAGSLSDAFLIVRKIASLPAELAGYLAELPERGIVNTVRMAFQLGAADQGIAHPITSFGMTAFAFAVLSIVILVGADVWTKNVAGTNRIIRLPLAMRWAGYYALVLIIILNWAAYSSQFIYFTF